MSKKVLSDKQITKMVQQAEAEFDNRFDDYIEKLEELEDERRPQSFDSKDDLQGISPRSGE